MLGDMVGVFVASRRTLVQFWQVIESLPSLNPNRLGLSLVVVASILGIAVDVHVALPAVAENIGAHQCQNPQLPRSWFWPCHETC